MSWLMTIDSPKLTLSNRPTSHVKVVRSPLIVRFFTLLTRLLNIAREGAQPRRVGRAAAAAGPNAGAAVPQRRRAADWAEFFLPEKKNKAPLTTPVLYEHRELGRFLGKG